jgi:predicted outer membrane protein
MIMISRIIDMPVKVKGQRMIKSKKISASLVAATLCVVSAGGTAAQAQEASTDQPLIQLPTDATTESAPSQVVSKCSRLIGARVENQQRQELGRIEDVVVSFHNERVSYCVLSIKHGIFAKTRFLAVPLAAFQPSEDGSHLVLNASRANLAKAKGVGRDEWGAVIAPAWGAEPGSPVELSPAVYFAPEAALNSRDKHFVSEFSNISLELERIGRLAQTQSQDTQVKELAQKIVQDYGQAAGRVAASGPAAGAGEPPQLSGSAARAVDKLADLSGTAFDQAALRELFKCQESGVRQISLEIGKGGNPALRQLAASLQEDTEPDVWQTSLLTAQFNSLP